MSRFKGIFLNLFSTLSIFITTLIYATLVQWAIFSPDLIQSISIWAIWGFLGGFTLFWICHFGSNDQWINETSLHPFYRARLTRAYLGVGNNTRFPKDDIYKRKDTDKNTITNYEKSKDVDQLVNGNDIDLENYKPENFGGPIHLINLCLNETKNSSPLGHGINLDRKACPVTISNRFVEVSRRIAQFNKDIHGGSLAQWISVSGAAVSSGAGARTNRGWSTLVYLFGARLGFWAKQFKVSEGQSTNQSKSIFSLELYGRFLWQYLPKLAMQLAELTATYDTAAPYCLLSDGGHFENTGVYPLISRKLPFIVLVDCGADPEYNFIDLQELIRRSRLDHQAEITFYGTEQATRLFPNSKAPSLEILSLEEIADNRSSRGVMLARICYSNGSLGTLLVVKPNLHESLPLDIKVYARQNLIFPQQATADQFFDEAQWESYQGLGFDFGDHLTDQWLSSLPNWKKHRMPTHPKEQLDTVLLEDFARLQNKAKGNWHVASSSAVGAGLGAGAVLAMIIPLLQTFNEYQKNEDHKDIERYQNKIKTATSDLEIIELNSTNEEEISRLQKKLKPQNALNLRVDFDNKKIPPILEDQAKSIIERLKEVCQPPLSKILKNTDYCGTFIAENNKSRDNKFSDNPYWLYKKPTKDEKQPTALAKPVETKAK